MASVESRSQNLDGYAEDLYVDNLGADGVGEVLDWIHTLSHFDAADGAIDGPDLRNDLLVPFATGFAVAVASPRGAPLVEHFSDINPRTYRDRQAAMLLSGAPQPPEFLVPVADAIIMNRDIDPTLVSTPIDTARNELLFGQSGPDDVRVVAVEALADNPPASADFAALGQDRLEALVFGIGPYDKDPGQVRFLDAASDVIEHAVITEGTLGTGDQRTSTDEILIDLITVADGDVPGQMKDHLAAISVAAMGRIEDFVVAGGDLQEEVQAYFAELSYSDTAVELLTLGALDQYQVGMQEGLVDLAELTPDLRSDPSNVNDYLEGGTVDGRALLGTLGAAFDDADVSEEQRHAAMLGTLNFFGDALPGVGVALTPLTGGTSALVGVGAAGIADLGISIFGDATAPEETDGEDFVAAVRPGVDDLTGRLLYDNEETQAALLEAIDSPRDPEAITIEEFLALSSVENIVALQAEAARQGTLLDVLENGYFR